MVRLTTPQCGLTVQPSWVSQSLETIMRLTARAGLRGLAMPILGRQSRSRDAEEFGELLMAAINLAGPARLRIALLAEPGITHRVVEAMRETAPTIEIEVA